MIDIIYNSGDMNCLKNEWNKLADRFEIPTLRYEWFRACADAFCKSDQLRIVLVRSENTVTAIAPLISIRSCGIERLELLGMSFLFEPAGFLYKNIKALRELYDAVLELKKPLILRRIRSNSPELSQIYKLKKRYLIRSKNDTGTLFIPMKKENHDITFRIPSRVLSNIRRKLSKAEKAGRIDFEVITPTRQNFELFFQEVCNIEASGWKGRNGTAIASDPLLEKFFKQYCQETAHLNMLRLFYLKINGNIAAVRVAVEYANCLWELKIGYDERWARYSPGLLLTYKTIMYAFERNLNAYEFLGDDAPWVRTWTNEIHAYTALSLYPRTCAGRLCFILERLRSLAGKLLK